MTKTHHFKTRMVLVLVLAACCWIGCGGDMPEPAMTTDTPDVESTPTQPANTPVEPTSKEATTSNDTMETMTPTPLALTPADVNPDEPIPVEALRDAYFAWKDQPVVVGGYLWVFGESKRGKLNRRITLTDAPGSAVELADCEFEDASGERVTTDQPLIIKGTHTRFSTATRNGQPKLQLKACEVISIGEAFDEGTEAMPGQTQPIPVQKLYAAVMGWQGKELTVVGYYHSSGYSSATGKTKINLRAGRGGKNAVGCQIPGENVTPENLKDNREGVIMRGTMGEPTFDQVILENCTFLNR